MKSKPLPYELPHELRPVKTSNVVNVLAELGKKEKLEFSAKQIEAANFLRIGEYGDYVEFYVKAGRLFYTWKFETSVCEEWDLGKQEPEDVDLTTYEILANGHIKSTEVKTFSILTDEVIF